MGQALFINLVLVLFLSAFPSTARGDSHQAQTVSSAIETPSAPDDRKKIIVGEVEDVILLPWGITLQARIDTGTAISALHARNVSVRNNIAEFEVDNGHQGLRLKLPVVDWVHVRTAAGVEKRPLVEIGICLGPKLIRTLATLRDRSRMTYPFLVGRSVLDGSFVVDTSRSNAVRPACSSDSL